MQAIRIKIKLEYKMEKKLEILSKKVKKQERMHKEAGGLVQKTIGVVVKEAEKMEETIPGNE